MKYYYERYDREMVINSESISIDFKEIVQHDVIRTSFPDFASKLVGNPEHVLSCLGNTRFSLYQWFKLT